MRRAAKIDDNQTAIVNTIRSHGFCVRITSAVGGGFSDTVISYGGRERGKSWLVEIKDGAKYPSQRKLTKAQVKFHAEWQAKIYIIETVEQANEWCEERKRDCESG
jgi:hypothetical protein